MSQIIELSGDIWQVDLEECGIPEKTAGYFVKGDSGWLLIETGPASSLENIIFAAKELGISLEQLKYIAVTHIHLDHAGGLGVTCRHFKNAQALVHYKGVRHMVDPSRLIRGATAVWGKEKMDLFGEIIPLPKEQVIPVKEGHKINLGNRIIEVWETPGHSKHHVCFYDSKTKGLFSGDAVGVYEPELSRKLNKPVIRNATPPPDFDGEQMLETLKRVALSDKVDTIYFTHFGSLVCPLQVIEQLIGQFTISMELAKQYYGLDDSLTLLSNAMAEHAKRALGISGPVNLLYEYDEKTKDKWEFMIGLMDLNAGGILYYLDNINTGK